MENIYLRTATKEDVDILYNWANDKAVRQNSFNTAPIPYENHVKWFNNILSDDTVLQYIMCDEADTPLGQIRLNLLRDKALISYSISPNHRGKGLGYKLLLLIIDKAKNACPDIKTLVGQVKYENISSIKVFEKCGFERVDEPEYIEYSKCII
jgi:RimJ/RimL family protein N-acetyltransferase